MLSSDKPSIWKRWDESRYVTRSVILGLITVLPGVLVLWWSASAANVANGAGSNDVVFPTILAEIGTTLIALGLLSILYEGFLKRALLHDIQVGLELNAGLTDTGLSEVTLEPDSIRLGELFGTSRTVHIFPASPLTWQASNFGWLTRLARERTIEFRVYLPEPGNYSELRNRPDGSRPHETREFCEAKFDEYRSLWDAAGLETGPSKLLRFAYIGNPHLGFIVANDAAVVYLEDPRGKNTELSGVAYVYKGSSASPTIAWLLEAVRRLDAAGIDGAEADRRSREQLLPLEDEATDVVPTVKGGTDG